MINDERLTWNENLAPMVRLIAIDDCWLKQSETAVNRSFVAG